MGVDTEDWPLLEQQVPQRRHQDQMLEDVGVVAGVKTVSIAEHAGILTREPSSFV